jgi:alkylation response protein AidB-like acyl-CoA dehydrogenase
VAARLKESAMPRNLYGPDHEAFRAVAAEFVERSLKPRAEEMLVAKSIDREIWREAGKQGLFGLDIPEEFGGAGADDYLFNAISAEELSKFNAAVSSCFGIHSDVCPPYIVDLGTEEQKQRWLPGMAAGELICAIAMTEPSGGSDLAALKTTAVRDGDDWILNGSKTFITNGFQCDLVIVAARTDPTKGPKGITLFMLEDGMPGFTRGRKLDKVGQEESDTAELFFENVRVSDANRLGPEGMGFIAMMQRLPQERVGAAVSNVAHAKQILLETIDYAKERKAFGQPIGAFQHNKFKLAEMVTAIEVAEAYVDDCIAAHAQGKLTAVDAAKAKWWSAQVQNDVLDDCVQMFGGYGFMNEYRVARAWRDARVTKIWAGSNEIMKELIGRDLGL